MSSRSRSRAVDHIDPSGARDFASDRPTAPLLSHRTVAEPSTQPATPHCLTTHCWTGHGGPFWGWGAQRGPRSSFSQPAGWQSPPALRALPAPARRRSCRGGRADPIFGGLISPLRPSWEWESHRSLTLQTDIWLVVRVPVLSEQMTEVQPRVSTEGKLLTMAFFFAIRRVPRARQVVMTAGRPVGRKGRV